MERIKTLFKDINDPQQLRALYGTIFRLFPIREVDLFLLASFDGVLGKIVEQWFASDVFLTMPVLAMCLAQVSLLTVNFSATYLTEFSELLITYLMGGMPTVLMRGGIASVTGWRP
eukprot:gene14165-10117_t